MNCHIPVVSFGGQSNSDAQPIATKRQAEMYCCKYCAKHHKNLGARIALYDIIDNMQQKDEAASSKWGSGTDTTKLSGQLHKAFMAEIGEEMCQAEVAHHANGIPEFFISRKVKHIHLYRKMLALNAQTQRGKKLGETDVCDDDGEDGWWSWWATQGGKRVHQVSDLELYMRRGWYWFPDGTAPSPYLPMQESPEAQVQAASLFDFFRLVQYHGGKEPYLTWFDPTGKEPSRMPIICVQPVPRLRENGGFARNAQWTLIQHHVWDNRDVFFFGTDDNGEPREAEKVKEYFRSWVFDEASSCPWHVREQYFDNNNKTVRAARQKKQGKQAATGLGNDALAELRAMSEARDKCLASDDQDGALDLANLIEKRKKEIVAAITCSEAAAGADASGSDGGADWSDTEESDTDGEAQGEHAATDKILRQLRGATKPQEIERQPEVERKATVVKSKHNFYRETRVTSRAQEEQSALPAGVINTHEDSSDDEAFGGEQKEIEQEVKELRAAKQVNVYCESKME